jgi:FixJ family two-component response regulator
MNGDQLAEEVKALNPAMPVIMLTGFGGEAIVPKRWT